MAVSPIPADYPRLSPYLCVRDARAALAWYQEALGATEVMRIPAPDGTVMHGEVRIGDSVVMVGEEAPAHGAFAPGHFGGTALSLVLYVADVDAAFARALAAGAREERPPADQPFGDRMGTLLDPFGHRWHLSSRVEEVPPAEIIRRMSGG
ncbi:VOC family protein [Falsiroseomonas ponticola]|uniref:VOC family protein n=1 Tax=Falsiroseomonas ponticola TaxID=2786951 RepID=UPI001932695A|nr:VOC family protein [Roseomonas ponticola]